MKLLAATLAVAAGFAATNIQPAQSKTKQHHCLSAHKAIRYYRQKTHYWQAQAGVRLTRVSKQKVVGCRYAWWVADLWAKRTKAAKRAVPKTTTEIIMRVFGSYGWQAITVARCESGLFTGAKNGQYLGLFQMGDYARSRYGHGSDALTQSKAAYAYFTDSGRDWSPWECKPA